MDRGVIVGHAAGAQRLYDSAVNIGAGRIEHDIVISERNLVENLPVVVDVEGGPATRPASQSLRLICAAPSKDHQIATYVLFTREEHRTIYRRHRQARIADQCLRGQYANQRDLVRIQIVTLRRSPIGVDINEVNSIGGYGPHTSKSLLFQPLND